MAPNRATALKSPYYETFKKHNKEVLLLYNTVDDFVMNNIKTYEGSLRYDIVGHVIYSQSAMLVVHRSHLDLSRDIDD